MIDDDEGSASVYAAGLILVMALISSILLMMLRNTIDAHLATNAANLAAVAGAYGFYTDVDACHQAEKIIQLHQASMVQCTIVDEDVVVTVQLRGATAQARAGPL